MVDRRYQGAGPPSPPPVRPQACQCRPAVQNASRARMCGHCQRYTGLHIGKILWVVVAADRLSSESWVTATPAGTDQDDAAMAVVRIRDSRHPLRHGAGYSARIS